MASCRKPSPPAPGPREMVVAVLMPHCSERAEESPCPDVPVPTLTHAHPHDEDPATVRPVWEAAPSWRSDRARLPSPAGRNEARRPMGDQAIGVGLVGCGMIGQIHADGLRKLADDGEIRAVAAADPSAGA